MLCVMQSMPETVLLADVITLDPDQPNAQGVLVSSGRVRAVGTRDDLLSLSPKAEVLDHRGAFLTPGLCDAHIHLVGFGFSLERVDLSDTTSPLEAVQRIEERAAHLPHSEWILGGGFFPNRWSELEFPTAAMLDARVPHHPVLMTTRDGHGAWVNSLALRLAGLHAGTPDPEGARIVRDEHGQPTGMLLEFGAMDMVRRVVPEPSLERTVAATQRAADRMAAWGFTSVHTMAAEPEVFLRAVQELEARDTLPLRVWACIPHANLEHVAASGLRGGTGNRVRLSGIKFFADGALGSRTAWMFEPYLGTSETGVIADPPELILERGRQALELGFCPVVHAIGDRANHEVLNVLEQLAPLARSRGVRLRLEHAQHLRPEDMARFGQLGIVASVQAIHLVDDAVPTVRLLGSERARYTYAFRSLLEAGAPLAMGADAPVATPDPVLGFRAAVTREAAGGVIFQPEQRLTPLQTLEAYTVGGAMAAGWEGWSGRVKVGFVAEFTLWDGDPSRGLARPVGALRF